MYMETLLGVTLNRCSTFPGRNPRGETVGKFFDENENQTVFFVKKKNKNNFEMLKINYIILHKKCINL